MLGDFSILTILNESSKGDRIKPALKRDVRKFKGIPKFSGQLFTNKPYMAFVSPVSFTPLPNINATGKNRIYPNRNEGNNRPAYKYLDKRKASILVH
jgi:hypothetical protein